MFRMRLARVVVAGAGVLTTGKGPLSLGLVMSTKQAGDLFLPAPPRSVPTLLTPPAPRRSIGPMDIVDFLLTRFQDDAAESRKLLTAKGLPPSDRWYEERLLRECEAKLMLIEIIGGARRNTLSRMLMDPEAQGKHFADELEWTTLALAAMAATYEDHPDYQDVWRLTEKRS